MRSKEPSTQEEDFESTEKDTVHLQSFEPDPQDHHRHRHRHGTGAFVSERDMALDARHAVCRRAEGDRAGAGRDTGRGVALSKERQARPTVRAGDLLLSVLDLSGGVCRGHGELFVSADDHSRRRCRRVGHYPSRQSGRHRQGSFDQAGREPHRGALSGQLPGHPVLGGHHRTGAQALRERSHTGNDAEFFGRDHTGGALDHQLSAVRHLRSGVQRGVAKRL